LRLDAEFEFGEKRFNIKAYVMWRREEFILQQSKIIGKKGMTKIVELDIAR
jgi:hypothetical protein